RAAQLASRSSRPQDTAGVALTPLTKTTDNDSIRYDHVEAHLDRDAGRVDISVKGPQNDPPADIAAATAQGAGFWPLAVTRELDDLILDLRTNEAELGTWVFRTEGDPARVLAYDELVLSSKDDWFAGEVLNLALAADRSFQLAGVFEDKDPDAEPATVTLADMNTGPLTMSNGLTRLQTRFWGDEAGYEAVAKRKNEALEAEDAADL